jgi:hypothetical protein
MLKWMYKMSDIRMNGGCNLLSLTLRSRAGQLGTLSHKDHSPGRPAISVPSSGGSAPIQVGVSRAVKASLGS